MPLFSLYMVAPKSMVCLNNIESLPRNSSSISLLSPPSLLGSKLKCSTRSEQHPTVSASSSVSFSPPTRNANRSMIHTAVASCFVSLSFDFKSFLYAFRMSTILSQSFEALLYLDRSDFPLKDELAASCMYFDALLIFSFHVANHCPRGSCRMSPQACPGTEHRGTAEHSDTFNDTCSGSTRLLSFPILGCSPRPRNAPGGSML
mmetsp:Transcript_3559/g.8490  ORF Transcript_3559/g.8490 Transcript_3559/m.8490 type:complete len:204 (+) Transcript_3559:1869-2480(+)